MIGLQEVLALTRSLRTGAIDYDIDKILIEENTDCAGNPSSHPHIIYSAIVFNPGRIDNIVFKEGDLVLAKKDKPYNDIACYIDRKGNLIVVGANSSKYYIDDDGNLMYDPCL